MNLRMSEVTIATRLRDRAQPIRMQVSFELSLSDILKLSYILKLRVNPIIIVDN